MTATTVEQRSVEVAERWTAQAEEAVKLADTEKLRNLLKEACKHNVDLAKAFDGMLMVYADSDKRKSPVSPKEESESAIGAMRDVALAAIELCKATLSSGNPSSN